MKKIITSKKKNGGILNLFVGHSLIAILLYITYRLGAFLIRQFAIIASITDFGVATALIAVTMIATSFLLRYDMRSAHKPVVIDNNEFPFQKERS